MTDLLPELTRWIVAGVAFALVCLVAAFVSAVGQIMRGRSCARKVDGNDPPNHII